MIHCSPDMGRVRATGETMAIIRGTRGDDYISAENDPGRDVVRGLAGDDRLIFRALRDRDVFDGGTGDDSLLDVDLYLPVGRKALARGIDFDGGAGFDTVEVELTVDRDDSRGNLAHLWRNVDRVESRQVDVVLDAQGSRPLDDFRLKGSKLAEEVTFKLDVGTAADGSRVSLGGGNDVFTVDFYYDADGFGRTSVNLGRGNDIYRSEVAAHQVAADEVFRVKGGGGRDTFELGASQERANGGGGADLFVLDEHGPVDVLRGGRGADTFLFDMRPLTGGMRAEIEDFRSGRDRVVIENFLVPGDEVYDDFAHIGPDGPGVYASVRYDRAEGIVYYDERAVLDLGAGTKAVSSDFLMVGDYDLIA